MVLVVDDSAVVRLAIGRRLRSDGCEVIEQASAALPDPATLARVTCALLDLDLGDSDGATLGRALLSASGRAGLPIAFFSSSTSGELLERARALGPVFAKPSELEAAVTWVRESTGREGAAK